MGKMQKVDHRFVERIPTQMEDGIVYISIEYGTAVHRCCCGCGEEVVTPLSPTDWKLIYDGETISLYPSIGNWSFKCESHYWIAGNRVRWARKWSKAEIAAGRQLDRHRKQQYFGEKGSGSFTPQPDGLRDMMWSLGGFDRSRRKGEGDE